MVQLNGHTRQQLRQVSRYHLALRRWQWSAERMRGHWQQPEDRRRTHGLSFRVASQPEWSLLWRPGFFPDLQLRRARLSSRFAYPIRLRRRRSHLCHSGRPELTITTSALPAAEVGVAYNSTLEASGGAPPRNWTISAGALPAGLSLNSATGQIGGTPSASGTFRITARVADSAGNQGERQFDVIVGGGFVITACPTLSAVIGEAYSSSLSLTGGDAPVAWAIASGALPGGLTLGPQTGAIAGTATDVGTFVFTIRASDAGSKTTSRACSINVNPSALRITAPSRLTDAILGTAYAETLQASGGRGPYGWSIAEGAMPPGVELGSTGTLSGTASTVGVYRFTVRVADADRGIATSVIELRVLPARDAECQLRRSPRHRCARSAAPSACDDRLGVSDEPSRATSTSLHTGSGLECRRPSIRFVDGSRAVEFEIPADSTEAVFAVPQFALQTGSVAGIINLDVSLTSGDFDVTPSPAPAKSLRVDRTAPVISSVRVNATAGDSK